MSKLGGFFFFFIFPGLTLIKVSQSVSQSVPHNLEVVMVTYKHYVPSKIVFEDKVSGNYVKHYPVEDFPVAYHGEGYRFAVNNAYGQTTHMVTHLAFAIVIALLAPKVA